jgi:hypothetical protein
VHIKAGRFFSLPNSSVQIGPSTTTTKKKTVNGVFVVQYFFRTSAHLKIHVGCLFAMFVEAFTGVIPFFRFRHVTKE